MKTIKDVADRVQERTRSAESQAALDNVINILKMSGLGPNLSREDFEDLAQACSLADIFCRTPITSGYTPTQAVLALLIANWFSEITSPAAVQEKAKEMIGLLKEIGGNPVMLMKLASPNTSELRAIEAKFSLGEIDISDAVKDAMTATRGLDLLERHAQCNWGPFVEPDEAVINDKNVKEDKGKVFSIHRIDEKKGDDVDNRIYIITDEDHEKTNMLLPWEYT
jgi:hypothetical protein